MQDQQIPDFETTQKLLNELHNLGFSFEEVMNNHDQTPKRYIQAKQDEINRTIKILGQHLGLDEKSEIFKNKSEDSLLNQIYEKIHVLYEGSNHKFFTINGNDNNTLILPTWYRSSHPHYDTINKQYPDNFRIRIDSQGNVSISLASTGNKRNEEEAKAEYENAIEWRNSKEVLEEILRVQQIKLEEASSKLEEALSDSEKKAAELAVAAAEANVVQTMDQISQPHTSRSIIANNLMTNTGGWLRFGEPDKQDKRTKVMKSAINQINNLFHCNSQVSGSDGFNFLGFSDYKVNLDETINLLKKNIAEEKNEASQKTLNNMIKELENIHERPNTEDQQRYSNVRLQKYFITVVVPLVAVGIAFAAGVASGGLAVIGICAITVGLGLGSMCAKSQTGHTKKERYLMSGYIDAIASKLPNVECWSSCKSGQDRTAAHEMITEAILNTDFSTGPYEEGKMEGKINEKLEEVYKKKKTTGALSKAACYVKLRVPEVTKFSSSLKTILKGFKKVIGQNEKDKKTVPSATNSNSERDNSTTDATNLESEAANTRVIKNITSTSTPARDPTIHSPKL